MDIRILEYAILCLCEKRTNTGDTRSMRSTTPTYGCDGGVCSWAAWLDALIRETADEVGMEIREVAIQSDHLHLFVSASPDWAPNQIVHRLTGYTARVLRQESSRFAQAAKHVDRRLFREHGRAAIGRDNVALHRRAEYEGLAMQSTRA